MTMEYVLENANHQAESVDVFFKMQQNSSVSFERNIIKSTTSKEISGTSVRVIKNNKMGFSSSSKPNDTGIVDSAIRLSEFGKKVDFELPQQLESKSFTIDPAQLEKIDEKFMINKCEEVVESLKSVHPEVLVSSNITKSFETSRLLNSSGIDITQESGKISWYCVMTHNQDGDFLTIANSRVENSFTGFGPLVKKSAEYYHLSQKKVRLKPKKYKVLFHPWGFLNIFRVFLSCLNGFNVATSVTPWKDKIGQKLFDDKISIRSNLIGEEASIRKLIDEEGTSTSITALVEKGVLNSFYHSLDTAAQCGHSPTGHGFRGSYSNQPMPEGLGMELAKGDSSLEEMRREADIWVEDLMGAQMSNPFSGTISGNIALGFTLDQGNITARIKNAMLNINVFELFKDAVLMVSDHQEKVGFPPYYPLIKTPYFLIDNVSISSK